MKTCLIITGGALDLFFASSLIKTKTYDLIIAVDAGLAAAQSLGVIPHIVVGDFDTVRVEVLNDFRQIPGIRWEEHCPEKNETDTELALYTAMEHGCENIEIIGALGGRMDHTLANLHLLLPCLNKQIKACLLDEKNKLYLLDSDYEFRKSETFGTYISFLPLTETVCGITLTGFRYPLFQQDIKIGSSLCVSNELSEEMGTLSFQKGILICIESKD